MTNRVAQIAENCKRGFEDFSGFGGFFWSQRVKMRPAREEKKVVLSPQLNSEKGSAETEQRNISIRGGCRLSTSALQW